jgi:hypothetical protein
MIEFYFNLCCFVIVALHHNCWGWRLLLLLSTRISVAVETSTALLSSRVVTFLSTRRLAELLSRARTLKSTFYVVMQNSLLRTLSHANTTLDFNLGFFMYLILTFPFSENKIKWTFKWFLVLVCIYLQSREENFIWDLAFFLRPTTGLRNNTKYKIKSPIDFTSKHSKLNTRTRR